MSRPRALQALLQSTASEGRQLGSSAARMVRSWRAAWACNRQVVRVAAVLSLSRACRQFEFISVLFGQTPTTQQSSTTSQVGASFKSCQLCDQKRTRGGFSHMKYFLNYLCLLSNFQLISSTIGFWERMIWRSYYSIIIIDRQT